MLAFSRKQTLRPQVLDLGEVLSDLTVVLKRLLSEKVILKVMHGRDLWPVKADLMQFEQVITNLAVNARDAMPNGGQLELRSANVTAQECARYHTKGMPAADYVMVEVTDTGTGIPEAIQDKIFVPFFTTKEVGKGTGLGLSTVYGIVKQTGGFVYFDTAENKGTTFRIFLPRHVPDGARRLAAGPYGCDRGGGARAARSPISPVRARSFWSKMRRACARSMPAALPRAATRCCKPATASRPSTCWKKPTARSISWSPTWSCRRWTARPCCANCVRAIRT